MARVARVVLRQKFLDADMGISGANFLVAETGSLVIITNEGNGGCAPRRRAFTWGWPAWRK